MSFETALEEYMDTIKTTDDQNIPIIDDDEEDDDVVDQLLEDSLDDDDDDLDDDLEDDEDEDEGCEGDCEEYLTIDEDLCDDCVD